MIQYDTDGTTLFYIDANGKKFSHYFTEGKPYSDMLVTLDAQQQAIRDNTLAANSYNASLATMQTSVDAGQADKAPPVSEKPLQKIVSDTGVVSFAPFDPPLADLVIPKTTPSQVNTADTGLTTYDMVLRMYQKMFPDA
jgi:hypothetical protein